MYLVDAIAISDLEAIRTGSPEIWRALRRFNAPVQLAVAAARAAASRAHDGSRALLVSLAPCRSGSPEVYRWVRQLHVAPPVSPVRVNPTHTLHAVDNLALSAIAVALGNHGHGLGFGGAAGQAWEALAWVLERFAAGEREALIAAGDQDSSEHGGAALAIALLVSAEPRALRDGRRRVRIDAVERAAGSASAAGGREAVPHAAGGLVRLASALERLEPGPFAYPVPDEHGDGMDRITVVGEVA